jgi:hypothetical protein
MLLGFLPVPNPRPALYRMATGALLYLSQRDTSCSSPPQFLPCCHPRPPIRHFELQLQSLELEALEAAPSTPFWAAPNTVFLRARLRESGEKFTGEGRSAGLPFEVAMTVEAEAEWVPQGWRLVRLQPLAPLVL